MFSPSVYGSISFLFGTSSKNDNNRQKVKEINGALKEKEKHYV